MTFTYLIVLISLCYFLDIFSNYCQCEIEIISYYENGIKEQVNRSLKYELPKSARSYKPTKADIKEYGIYDFIVIGSGSTGAVIANRLSKVKEWNILLLEAGDFKGDIEDIPNMAASFLLSSSNWGYTSVPQTTACLDMVDRKCSYPRGKGIGGSTLINGLVYARGNKLDFDRWSQDGNPGWSFNEVFPYFKISENLVKNDNKDIPVDYTYHHNGGELDVEYPIPRHPETNLWLEAHKEKGYTIVDFNGKFQIGGSIAQLNTKHGRRHHAGKAFITPIKDRTNLKILTESYVTKIIISENNKTAVGVKFVRQGQTYIAKISKEVILSAGAIASPQLLLLSGVGPARHLREVGIKSIEDLEVGSKLRDHPAFYGLRFDSNFTKTHLPLGDYIKEYLKGRGFLTVPNNNYALGFYKSKYENTPNYPDLEIMMETTDGFFDSLNNILSSAKEKTWEHLNQKGTFSLSIIALHTKSTGTIRLKSNDPFEYPLIDSRFLSDSENTDINTLYEGIQLALNLVNSEAFKSINTSLIKQHLPACENIQYLSRDYWYCVLRYFTHNLYHPVGTCPMGPDPRKGAVVDSETRVYGIKQLRVADASIFPFTLSGHPNAPCVMIGEKVSDLIKLQYL